MIKNQTIKFLSSVDTVEDVPLSSSVQEQLDGSCVQNQFLHSFYRITVGVMEQLLPYVGGTLLASVQGNENIQTSFCERVGGLREAGL